MPVAAGTANLTLSIVQTLIKLGGRIDSIYAGEAATRSELALPDQAKLNPPDVDRMASDLRRFLDDNPPADPDPLGDNRAALESVLDDANATAATFIPWMEAFVPEKLVFELEDPSGRAAVLLQSFRDSGIAEELGDADANKLLYYLGPGKDLRETSLPWQLATAVLSGLAEFGLENQEQLIRRAGTRRIAVAILTRFATPDLVKASSGKVLLKHVIRSTLNGALDAQGSLDADNPWLEAALSALSDARESQAADVRDDFLLGLVQGRGYKTFVAELLEEGADRLGKEGAEPYRQVIADVILEASKKVDVPGNSVEQFFKDHWTDLARAGLRSLKTHGPMLLDDSRPILREALLAAIDELAQNEGRDLLSGANLIAATEAAISAVAARPELLGDGTLGDWLRTFYGSFAEVVADQGLTRVTSREGLERIAAVLAGRLAAHPELIVDHPGLPQKLVGMILGNLAAAEGFQLEDASHTVVQAVLAHLADNPTLLNTEYGEVLADFAGNVAGLLNARSLTALQAAELLEAAASAVAANPKLFIEIESGLVRQVVSVILETAQNDPEHLLTSSGVVELADSVLHVLASHGVVLLGGQPGEELADQIGRVVHIGISAAAQELGRQVDLPAIPAVVAALVDAWARGELPQIAIDDPVFIELFVQLAERATREAA